MLDNDFFADYRQPIGYRKNGKPIYRIAGGSEPVTETVSPVVAAGFTQQQVNEAIEKARQEEKDKLYNRLTDSNKVIEELKTQQQDLQNWRKQQEDREKALRDEQAALEKRQQEEELSAKELVERRQQEWEERINTVQQTWEQKLEEERQRRESAEALSAKEREFNNLREYAQQKVMDNAENIAPELVDWIQGNSPAEIDASIARAIRTTEELTAGIQNGMLPPDPSQQQQVAVPQQQVTGTRSTSGPANMDPTSQYQSLTQEDISKMSMAEYAKIRNRLGVGSSQGKGLYG